MTHDCALLYLRMAAIRCRHADYVGAARCAFLAARSYVEDIAAPAITAATIRLDRLGDIPARLRRVK